MGKQAGVEANNTAGHVPDLEWGVRAPLPTTLCAPSGFYHSIVLFQHITFSLNFQKGSELSCYNVLKFVLTFIRNLLEIVKRLQNIYYFKVRRGFVFERVFVLFCQTNKTQKFNFFSQIVIVWLKLPSRS